MNAIKDHEWTVGDFAAIVNFNRSVPPRKVRITEVKALKRGLKVVTGNGDSWDVQERRRWGQRTIDYYTGPHLEPWTPKHEDALQENQWKTKLFKLARGWEHLTRAQKKLIGDALQSVDLPD